MAKRICRSGEFVSAVWWSRWSSWYSVVSWLSRQDVISLPVSWHKKNLQEVRFFYRLASMPALSADWPQVKGTAIATGSLKTAAEHHGVSYDALKMRASRESWPVGRRVHAMAQSAREAAHAQIVKVTGNVTSVTSTADALQSVLSENKKRTKVAQSRYLARASEELDKTPDTELLSVTDAALQLATMASKVYPEDQHGTGNAVVVTVNLSGKADTFEAIPETHDVDAEWTSIPDGQESPLDDPMF